jgi:serine/threonine-protein kinase|nr:serine/threonine-protein kinase [Kofleriaceae bacterium]
MSRDDEPTDIIGPAAVREPATEPVVDDEPGDQLQFDVRDERYSVINRLGKGGMGEVMAVRDTAIGREVALKRIRRTNPSEQTIARFLREASIQARLDHPAIVPVHDIGRDSHGTPFFTMKKLSGTTLAKILDGDRAGYPLQSLLRAFADVCLAIEFAHVRGIIHRDLKPENIVLGEFGEVYVIDWGVAKIDGEHDPDFTDVTGSGENVTQAGAAIGTPGYMPPEQVRGDLDLDARADVYALGCMLFEILSGQMLHPSGKAGLASALAGGDTRPSSRTPWRQVPPELDKLCGAATAPDRDHRLATARALGDGVVHYLDGDRDLALRRQLGRDHLERARAAFDATAAGDDEQRTVAMREAASALALDPQLAGAAELVGRLMIEPPRTTPPEVEQMMSDDDATTRQGGARGGVISFLAFLAFMPAVWWIAPSGSPYLLALTAMVLVNLGLCLWGASKKTYGREGLLAIGNAVLLGIVSRMFTPFLIAPGLAAMSAMAILFTPTTSRLTSTVGVTLLAWAAVLVPWILERVGVLSVTTTVDASGILMRAAGTEGAEGPTLAVAIFYVLAMIGAGAGMATAMRERTRVARRALYVQTWQLRQLVPH